MCLIPGLLAELGVDPAAVFAAAGAPMAMFADRETLLPLSTIAKVVSLSIEASGRRDLGLHVDALRARADHLGLLGDLFVRAETLRAGLKDISAYVHLNLRGAVAHLDASDGVAEVQLTLPEALGAARAAFEDLAIAVLFHAMTGYLGSRWRPHEVRFSHGPPGDPTTYRRLFGEAVSFDALNGGVAFAAADLERSMTAHDRRRRRLERRPGWRPRALASASRNRSAGRRAASVDGESHCAGTTRRAAWATVQLVAGASESNPRLQVDQALVVARNQGKLVDLVAVDRRAEVASSMFN